MIRLFIQHIFCFLAFTIFAFANDPSIDKTCATYLKVQQYPRQIDPEKTFDALVQWIHDDLIIKRGAPGFVIGISGTDSVLTFLACAKAFEKAGKPDRVVGIHYADTNPHSDKWFQNEVIPWLKLKAPSTQIIVDTSIDSKRDGQRWGALMDWSVIEPSSKNGTMRPAQERYWLVGTRNATEVALFTYSNASTIASVQVLTHLWKSEVLQITKYLGVPEIAIAWSCEVDCPCGRMQLPAYHIPEVDALLMVRNGTLLESYVKENIPQDLRNDLTEFIETQINVGQFKKQIPYEPESSVTHTRHVLNPVIVAAVKKSIIDGSSDSKPISKLTHEIIAKSQANTASDLVCSQPSPNRENWLPEALVLFNTPGLRLTQKRQMIASIFLPNDLSKLGPFEVAGLSKSNGRIGNYGFSFPQWRFLTQRFADQPSLAEAFGMLPLTRNNDIRDATLDPSNPERDELGRGFIWIDSNWYVEYRRAYIIISNRDSAHPAALVIRNNSYYFGRNRLKNAVYFSLSPVSTEDLKSLTVNDLENSNRFTLWQDLLKSKSEILLKEKLSRISRLLDYLDKFNMRINQWLRNSEDNGGSKALLNFFEFKLKGQSVAINKPQIYLGLVENDSPSWNPKSMTPLTSELVTTFRESLRLDQVIQGTTENSRIIMTSGANGDFP